MRPIVSLITAASVALHLVLGCCAHHGHAEEGRCAGHRHGSPCETAHQHSHGCPHEHGQATPESESPTAPQPPHDDCDGGQCAFMTAVKTTFVPNVFVAAIPFAAIQSSADQATLTRAEWTRDCDQLFEPSVRPHLLHQIFLN